jgi:cytochrome c peroxidase
VAVAFLADGKQLAVQTRAPAGIVVLDTSQVFANVVNEISFGNEARRDTGHDIFHRDAGNGIACASCHVEGTDDGRTWNFKPIGARRTQPVDVGLRGTEPFHWDGTLPTMDKLMNEVFVTRMGGPRESGARVDALSEWVFQLRPRAPLRPVMDASAERGKALFDSNEVGCASCHNGPKFTNNATADVGTGEKLQVPSLLGVSQRLPLMHNGCAKTLMDRFDASCGGNAHGNVANLSRDQLLDLSAYLESI